jgi:outer membrane protein TolC
MPPGSATPVAVKDQFPGSPSRPVPAGWRRFGRPAPLLAGANANLAAGGRTADQESLQEQVVAQARIALRLAEIRYREGVDDLLVLLDTQRALFQAVDQLAQTRLSRLQASVSLLKALGGGWEINEVLSH